MAETKKIRWKICFFVGLILICTLASFAASKDRGTGYYRVFEKESLISAENLEKGKVSAKTQTVSLPAGTYRATVHYKCDKENNTVEIRSEKDNAYIEVLNQPVLDPENKQETVEFSLKEITSNLSVCVLYGGEGDLKVNNIELCRMDGAGMVCEIIIWVLVFAIVCLCLKMYVKGAKLSLKEREGVLLICLAAVVASAPLFLPYLIDGHDMLIHLNRIEGIASGLKNGQFPVRIHASSHGGYGSSFAVFYPELFLYIPAVFRLLGMSLTSAVQLFFLLVNIVSGMTMYHCGRRIFHSGKIGCMAGIMYILAVYRLGCMYTRFALGELLAITFLPLVVCAVYELFWGDTGKWILMTVAFTCVFQSHILSTLLVAAYCVIYSLLHVKRLFEKSRMITLAKVGVSTVLLNLWTLIPLLDYNRLGITDALRRKISDRGMYVAQLLDCISDASGKGNWVGKKVTTMPINLGLPILIGCCLFLCVVYRMMCAQKRENEAAVAQGFSVAFELFLMGSFAAFMATCYFPWNLLERIPLIEMGVQYLQFPFRLMAFADVLLVLAGVYGFAKIFDGKEKTQMILIVLVISVISASFLLSDFMKQEPEIYRGETVNTYVSPEEYKFKGTSKQAMKADMVNVSSDSIQYTSYEKKGTNIRVDITAENEGYIELPLLWFPGYKAKLSSGEILDTVRGDNNVVRVMLPKGTQGMLNVRFEENWLWKTANIISLITLLGGAGYLIRRKIRTKAADQNAEDKIL